MDINEIVEGAYARATLEFMSNVDQEIKWLQSADGGGWNIAIAEARATRKHIPGLVRTALKIALTDFANAQALEK